MSKPNEAGVVTPQEFIQNAEGAGAPALVTNGTLRHEEHLAYSEALVRVARQRLRGIQDLRNAGLTVNLGGIGTMLSLYERVSEMTQAEVTMDGNSMARKDRVTYDEAGVPVPIFHKSWQINKRNLEASRKLGQSLDTTQIEAATFEVIQRLESALFNGIPGLVVGGQQIYGYTNHPDRITGSMTGTGWHVVSGRNIIGDTEKMLDAAYQNNFFGPFIMYVAKNVWATLQGDYSTQKGERTFIERIRAFEDITDVRAGDLLPANHVVMVQMTSDVVDLAVGADIQNMEWSEKPFSIEQMVWMCAAPRVKSSKIGETGIVHYTPA